MASAKNGPRVPRAIHSIFIFCTLLEQFLCKILSKTRLIDVFLSFSTVFVHNFERITLKLIKNAKIYIFTVKKSVALFSFARKRQTLPLKFEMGHHLNRRLEIPVYSISHSWSYTRINLH